MKWSDLWLPPDFSRHGLGIDRVFLVIVVITAFFLVLTQGLLLYAVIRFRRRDGVKAKYSHGSGKVELLWTALPLGILLWLAFYSNGVFDAMRESNYLNDPNAAHVLIIAQQFNWNPVYAGRDEKLGQYLVYPRPTDPLWPRDARGHAVLFPLDHPVKGPADLTPEEFNVALTQWKQDNPFGKVEDPALDPDGADDIQGTQGTIDLPVDRPTVLEITSKDVIHDFFVPELRINVYAIPGMTAQIAIRPTATSKSLETSELYDVATLQSRFAADPDLLNNLAVDIDPTPGKYKDRDRSGWRYFYLEDGRKHTIIRDGKGFIPDADLRQQQIDELLKNGITQIRAHMPAYFEVICAQLCGDQHARMEGRIVVLDQADWAAKYEKRQRR
ncbi:MAG TPA: cytochrome c oxidase subunit II transmembrane domain-containing protein [Tepidisphaeraceae bacterium]|nr:cytochrome c oxidase subunit II transmembrane domain-containing protein [Tepidisphaeraceae bacterium]